MTHLPLRLNILSDLHLSQDGLALPDAAADIVVLAGDIARPKQAIDWAQGFNQPVVYVPGNHEFYGSSLRATVAHLKDLRSDEHTSELQSLMRISYAVFCFKKKNKHIFDDHKYWKRLSRHKKGSRNE